MSALLGTIWEAFRTTRHPPQVVYPWAYFCDTNECTDPQRLDQLLYGCNRCLPPYPADKLPEKIKARIQAAISSAEGWVWPECPDHPLLRVVPRCLTCSEPIHRLGYFPPLGIWGTFNTGKTVYCAVLAREMLSCGGFTTAYDRGDYVREVVDPLFGAPGVPVEGRLPQKTRPAEHRKLVLKVIGQDWAQRTVTLTDMSGEVFMLTRAAHADPELAKKQRLMLYTRESIFLANPEYSSALGATARTDATGAVQELFNLPPVQARLACLPEDSLAEHRVTRLAQEVQSVLEMQGFPADLTAVPGGPPYDSLASDLAALFQDSSLTAEIRGSLTKTAELMRRVPRFSEQLELIQEFMSGHNFPRSGDKLSHRLAVAVSKTDLLPDFRLGYKRILNEHGIGAGLGEKTGRAPRATWQKALRAVCERSREALLGAGEEKFVEFAENSFAEVGYFFISALGRGTEVFAHKVRVRRSAPQAQPAVSSDGVAPATARGGDGEWTWTWAIDSRVKIDPATGMRAPTPKYVTLPLLWLLSEA